MLSIGKQLNAKTWIHWMNDDANKNYAFLQYREILTIGEVNIAD